MGPQSKAIVQEGMEEKSMKKRSMAALLVLLVLFAAAGAAATDYGTAVIDAHNSTKLHLREKPSAEAKSLGLFFTGTPVKCLSDPAQEWVNVAVGAQTGYMKSEYLRTGEAAQGVLPGQMQGVVTANRAVNLRQGPSTAHRQIGSLEPNACVTVLGETAEHWYYVQAGDQCGYVSAKLMTLAPSPAVGAQQAASWQAAYLAYLQPQENRGEGYALIFVNDDDVPELVVDSGVEAGGCRIVTWSDGALDVLQTDRRGFTYMERKNLLCNADGLMGYYYDVVYSIRNGRWKRIAGGEYQDPVEDADMVQGRYVCRTYLWNGESVTMEAYLDALHAVYPQERARSPLMCSYAEIIRAMKP